ncbi:hypothetical protein E3N88_17520 [Mikania micrantha]|uniref:RRM domain-containing protein n=1 Tax=Mikania micrantha TaxID=192012 RepID=A0A5N6NSN1_9ASTR|nr:hypothetical protein E3N88_17520 [Mikania micrantha]
MSHTRSQGPPSVLAFEEPEQEFHMNLRSRLSQVRILAPILFSPSSSTPSSPSHTSTSPFSIPHVFFDMAEEIPPPYRRTVHDRACDGFTGVRNPVTRPVFANDATWQFPSYIMTIWQFHSFDDDEDDVFYYRYSSATPQPPSSSSSDKTLTKSSSNRGGGSRLAPSKSTVYAGNLDYSLTNSDIFTIFSTFGKVAKVTILRDRVTRESRGVAFVLFVARDDALGPRERPQSSKRGRSEGGGDDGYRRRKEGEWGGNDDDETGGDEVFEYDDWASVVDNGADERLLNGGDVSRVEGRKKGKKEKKTSYFSDESDKEE